MRSTASSPSASAWRRELGAYLDPLADKVLIVSIYVSLGIVDAMPRWLVILVVSRDMLIVGAVMLSWLIGKPVSAQAADRCPSSTPSAQILLRSGWCWRRSASVSMRGSVLIDC